MLRSLMIVQILGAAYGGTNKNCHMEGNTVVSDVDPGCHVNNVFGGCSECWADAERHTLTCLSNITHLPYTADCKHSVTTFRESGNKNCHMEGNTVVSDVDPGCRVDNPIGGCSECWADAERHTLTCLSNITHLPYTANCKHAFPKLTESGNKNCHMEGNTVVSDVDPDCRVKNVIGGCSECWADAERHTLTCLSNITHLPYTTNCKHSFSTLKESGNKNCHMEGNTVVSDVDPGCHVDNLIGGCSECWADAERHTLTCLSNITHLPYTADCKHSVTTLKESGNKNCHMEGNTVVSDVDPDCRVKNVIGGCSECWADAERHTLTCLSNITHLPYTADCKHSVTTLKESGNKNCHMEGNTVVSDVDPDCRVKNVIGGCSECWADAEKHTLTCLSNITHLPYTTDCKHFIEKQTIVV